MGPFNGHGINLERKLEEEELFGDSYVKLLLRHLNDPQLFKGSPEDSRARQRELIIPFLDFFLRHDQNDYYKGLFRRKGFLDESSSQITLRNNIALEGLAKLRIHSDDLRGIGQHKRLIREIDPAKPPIGSQIHSSSGTTQNSIGPVTILRSPITIHLERLVNGGIVSWAVGHSLEDGYCLMQMAPEMTDFMTFASFAADVMLHLGCEVVFGNKLREDDNEPNVWRRLEPNRGVTKTFFTSTRQPKFLITGSAGLFNTLTNPSLLKRLAIRFTMKVPPINLGKGGVLMTGGGLKRVPTRYSTMREFFSEISDKIIVGHQNGRIQRAPIIDYLGLTESASIFANRANDPLSDDAWIKYPHPLTYMAMLESSQKLIPVPNDEYDRSRLLFYVNFACIDYLEAVVSGDFVKRVKTPKMHQHGFVYDRRADSSEGFHIREGCG